MKSHAALFQQHRLHQESLERLLARQHADMETFVGISTDLPVHFRPTLHSAKSAIEPTGRLSPSTVGRRAPSTVTTVTSKTDPSLTREEVAFQVRTRYQSVVEAVDKPSTVHLWLKRVGLSVDCTSIRRSLSKRRFRLDRLAKFASSSSLQYLVCATILLNAVFIGVVSHLSMQCAMDQFDNESGTAGSTCREETWEATVDYVFTGIFLAELVLRMMAFEGMFWIGKDWVWNVLDLFLVGLSLLGLGLEAFSFDLKMIRLLRFLRMLRTFRIIRLLRFASFFRTLRLMLLAVIKSAVPLLWALLILFFFLFMFAVIFQQAVASYVAQAQKADSAVVGMRIFFESMPMTLLTLFMTMSGGVSWWDICQMMLTIHSGYGCLFVLFISIMLLAVLNVITGTFVNEAVEVANMDRDLRSQRETERQKVFLKELRQLFFDMDCQQMGTIQLAEFEETLQREDVKAALSILGLDVNNAVTFFKLLDADCSQKLEIDEFVIGCMRLQGMAKAVDIETLMYENRRLNKRAMRRQQNVSDRLIRLEGTLAKVNGCVQTVETLIRESCGIFPDSAKLEHPRPFEVELVSTIRDSPEACCASWWPTVQSGYSSCHPDAVLF